MAFIRKGDDEIRAEMAGEKVSKSTGFDAEYLNAGGDPNAFAPEGTEYRRRWNPNTSKEEVVAVAKGAPPQPFEKVSFKPRSAREVYDTMSAQLAASVHGFNGEPSPMTAMLGVIAQQIAASERRTADVVESLLPKSDSAKAERVAKVEAKANGMEYRLLSKPPGSDAEIRGANTQTPTLVNANVAGTYEIRLVVTDDAVEAKAQTYPEIWPEAKIEEAIARHDADTLATEKHLANQSETRELVASIRDEFDNLPDADDTMSSRWSR